MEGGDEVVVGCWSYCDRLDWFLKISLSLKWECCGKVDEG